MAPSDAPQRPAVERRHPPDWLMRVMNPIMRRRLERGSGSMAEQLLLIRVTGRRTGRPLQIVSGRHQIEGRIATMTNSPWRLNFRGGRDCELVLAGTARRARGELLEDVDAVARIYDRLIGELGVKGAQRRLGIKVNLDRRPTLEEVAEGVGRSHLSVIFFTLSDAAGPDDRSP